MNQDPTWMSVLLNYGPLGVFAVCVAAAIAWAGREYWVARRPHMERKWAAEAAKEEAASKLFDTLRESEGTKNQILETLTEVQRAHASDCRSTAVKVDEIHKVVVLGKAGS